MTIQIEIRRSSRGRFNWRLAGAPYPYNRFVNRTLATESEAVEAARAQIPNALKEAAFSGGADCCFCVFDEYEVESPEIRRGFCQRPGVCIPLGVCVYARKDCAKHAG